MGEGEGEDRPRCRHVASWGRRRPGPVVVVARWHEGEVASLSDQHRASHQYG